MLPIIFVTLYTLFQIPTKMFSHETKMFSGAIEFPHCQMYDVSLFYKGQKLSIDTQSTSNFIQFSFVDSTLVQELFLIITDDVTHCCQESNNVACLSLQTDSNYICYRLYAQRHMDAIQDENLTWKVEQYSLPNNQIPENSVIFLFNPQLISGLKIQSWKPENLFRIIPTIVIKDHATISEIQRAIDIARLVAMDIDVLHRKSDTINPATALLTAWH